ncbi:MAG TPA: tetratricopeptide repeat protein, partial [Pyrinomonadaceae bacterium]|nr:tetratricopeptide repeat protein [Pyrinomonadaceae bacterium]
ESDAALQRELATAYERIGKIQGNSFFSNLGDTAGAMTSYQKSLEIRRRLHQTDPTDHEIQHELAASYEGVGDIFNTDNNLPNGLQNYDEALKLRLLLIEAEPQNRKNLLALADLYTRRALIKGTEGYANLGDTLGALDEHFRAVAIAEKVIAIQSDEEAQTFLAGDLTYLAMQQNAIGKTADALENGRKAVEIYEKLAAQNPNNAQIKEYLLNALTVLRYSLVDENLLLEAEKNARYVLAETEKASAADPKDANGREDLSISYNDLARVLRESGKAQEAIPLYERSLQIIKKLASEASNDEFKTNLALTCRFMAEAQLQIGDYKAAFANYECGAATYEKDLAESPENARTKDDLAITYTGMGIALAGMKQHIRAAEFFSRAVPLAEEAASKSPHNARIQSRLAKTYFENGKNWKQYTADEQSQTKSCELLQKSFDVWEGLRQKGALSRSNAPQFDEVSRELSMCH